MESNWQGRGEFRSASVEPEILRPGEESSRRPYYRVPPPVQQSPRRMPRWASAPATYVLVGINCFVFLAMLLTSGSWIRPSSENPIFWLLASNGGLVLMGQWWRVLTATFVHLGWIHLLSNMWCLWNLGLLGEPLLGPFGVAAAYVLTGVAGNLLSVAVHPALPNQANAVISAGASGAVFGLAGVLILLLKSPLLPLPKLEVSKLRRSVIYFAVFNFVIDAGIWAAPTSLRIDNMAHLGGFLSGLAFGLPLVPRIGAPRALFLRRRLLATAVIAFLLLLLAFGLHSFWR